MSGFSPNAPNAQLFISSAVPDIQSLGLAEVIAEYLEESDVATSYEVYYFGPAFLIKLEPAFDATEAAILLKLRFEDIEVEMKRAAR